MSIKTFLSFFSVDHMQNMEEGEEGSQDFSVKGKSISAMKNAIATSLGGLVRTPCERNTKKVGEYYFIGAHKSDGGKGLPMRGRGIVTPRILARGKQDSIFFKWGPHNRRKVEEVETADGNIKGLGLVIPRTESREKDGFFKGTRLAGGRYTEN